MGDALRGLAVVEILFGGETIRRAHTRSLPSGSRYSGGLLRPVADLAFGTIAPDVRPLAVVVRSGPITLESCPPRIGDMPRLVKKRPTSLRLWLQQGLQGLRVLPLVDFVRFHALGQLLQSRAALDERFLFARLLLEFLPLAFLLLQCGLFHFFLFAR